MKKVCSLLWADFFYGTTGTVAGIFFFMSNMYNISNSITIYLYRLNKGVSPMAQRTATDIMEKNFVTAKPDASVFELVNLFVKNKITSIPIVDEEDNLIGIVTDADLLYKKVKPHVPHYVNLLGASIYYSGISSYDRGFKKLMAGTARELMTKDVIIAAGDAPVEQIAGVMVAEHLKVIPIVTDKKVIGVVTRGNILDELYRDFGQD